jgi:hypothetical protein
MVNATIKLSYSKTPEEMSRDRGLPPLRGLKGSVIMVKQDHKFSLQSLKNATQARVAGSILSVPLVLKCKFKVYCCYNKMSRSTVAEQLNVWSIQEQLAATRSDFILESHLKALRDQYEEHSLRSAASRPRKITVKKKVASCLIL